MPFISFHVADPSSSSLTLKIFDFLFERNNFAIRSLLKRGIRIETMPDSSCSSEYFLTGVKSSKLIPFLTLPELNLGNINDS